MSRNATRITATMGAAVFVAAAVLASAQPVAAADGRVGYDEVDTRRTALAGITDVPAFLWDRQERLDRVVEDIRAEAGSADGFAGAIVDAERNRLSLYWHGTVPPGISAHAEQAREHGMSVVVAAAPYTEVELLREADRISRLPLFQGARTGQRMMRVGPRADGSGLDVGIYGLPRGVDTAQARQLVPALASAVSMTVNPMGPIAFTSRAFDAPEYWGGSLIARLISASPFQAYECTSAFGVTGLNGAAQYLITAAHCGEGTWGSVFVSLGGGAPEQLVYGNTIPAGRAVGRDVQLIHTPEGSEGRVYWGAPIDPPNGGTGSTAGVAVSGDSANNVNDSFCLSGAYSGTICESLVRIVATNQTVVYDPPLNGVGRVTNLASGAHIGGRLVGIAGSGDSGGPVVSVAPDGSLLARGVISGMELGEAERPCQGYAPPGRRCSAIVYFADLRGAMSAVGVRINTL